MWKAEEHVGWNVVMIIGRWILDKITRKYKDKHLFKNFQATQQVLDLFEMLGYFWTDFLYTCHSVHSYLLFVVKVSSCG